MNNKPDFPSIQESLFCITGELAELNDMIRRELARQEKLREWRDVVEASRYDSSIKLSEEIKRINEQTTK